MAACRLWRGIRNADRYIEFDRVVSSALRGSEQPVTLYPSAAAPGPQGRSILDRTSLPSFRFSLTSSTLPGRLYEVNPLNCFLRRARKRLLDDLPHSRHFENREHDKFRTGRLRTNNEVENKLLRGPDSRGWKEDLAEVEQRLRRLNSDNTFTPEERELERIYFDHWRRRLRYLLSKQGLSFEESDEGVKDAPNISLNDVNPSDESWKVITPRTLFRAVLKIRYDFEHLCDAQRDAFRDKCFKDLHLLPTGMTEPIVFKNHFDNFIRRLQQILIHSFGRFLEISLVQEGLIAAASVHWASLQITDLIDREDRLADSWTKSVCDKPADLIPTSSEEFIHQVIFRTDWRAPRWLVMQPNGNAVYNPSMAWERMDESDTNRILGYLRENRWILLLESALTNIAGVAHETLAKRKASTEKAQSEETTASTKASERTPSSSQKPLMVKYRSGMKRAILGAIMKNPNASDADVCRFLDADGGEELPAGWKARREDRSFFDAYSNPSARRKVEIAISKIRRDLRDRGLLP